MNCYPLLVIPVAMGLTLTTLAQPTMEPRPSRTPVNMGRLLEVRRESTQRTYTELRSSASGRCVDVPGAAATNGLALQQFSCHQGPAQLWELRPEADGYYRLASLASGKCLDVAGASLADGARVQQFDCHGGANQQWSLVPRGDGDFALISVWSGRCLDVAGGSSADGAALQQYGCHGGANQAWRLRDFERVNNESRPSTRNVVRQGRAMLPFNHGVRPIAYEMINNRIVIEGDMVVPAPLFERPLTSTTQSSGPGVGVSRHPAIVRDSRRWPGGVIPFQFAVGFTSQQIATIQSAIATLNASTNLKIVPRQGQSDYVEFSPDTSCYSEVGRSEGKQIIGLAAGCGKGPTMHELLHAAGVWHEQSRGDRDQFIIVLWDNIKDGQEHNFNVHNDDGIDLGPYDFGSIMHYGATAFGVNGKETIIPINQATRQPDRSILIGQSSALSPLDIAAVNLIYPAAPASTGSNCTYSASARSQISTLLNVLNTSDEAREAVRSAVRQAREGAWEDAANDFVGWWVDNHRTAAASTLLVHFPLAFREAAQRVGITDAPALADPAFVRQDGKCVLDPAIESHIWDLLRFQVRVDRGSIEGAVEQGIAGDWEDAADDFLEFWARRSLIEGQLMLRHFAFALRSGATLVGMSRPDGSLVVGNRGGSLRDPQMQ